MPLFLWYAASELIEIFVLYIFYKEVTVFAHSIDISSYPVDSFILGAQNLWLLIALKNNKILPPLISEDLKN